MLHLPNVTLVSCTCSNFKLEETLFALEHSMRQIKFAKTILITDTLFKYDGITVIPNERLKDYWSYSDVMLFDLYKYIDTDYCLIVQYDGYVYDANKWSDEFLKYDYLGHYVEWCERADNDNNKFFLINGGFSLRSKKLMKMYELYGEDEFRERFKLSPYYYEDNVYSVTARLFYESTGCAFPDKYMCDQFSTNNYDLAVNHCFGFHACYQLMDQISLDCK